MFKLSEIISKPVLSIFEGVKVGFVKNACFDEKIKKLKGFLVFNDDSEGSEMFVSAKNIFVIGEDSILIKNLDMMSSLLPKENSPVNTGAFSFSGEFGGEINDVIFDEKMNVCFLLTNKDIKIEIEKVYNVGLNTIFYCNEDIKICVAKMKPKIQSFSAGGQDIKVNIMEVSNPTLMLENRIEMKNVMPTRVSSGGEFLLGRKATKSILGLNNEYIIKKGQVVTEKIIQVAKQHNKVNELTYNSNN